MVVGKKLSMELLLKQLGFGVRGTSSDKARLLATYVVLYLQASPVKENFVKYCLIFPKLGWWLEETNGEGVSIIDPFLTSQYCNHNCHQLKKAKNSGHGNCEKSKSSEGNKREGEGEEEPNCPINCHGNLEIHRFPTLIVYIGRFILFDKPDNQRSQDMAEKWKKETGKGHEMANTGPVAFTFIGHGFPPWSGEIDKVRPLTYKDIRNLEKKR